MCYLKNKEGITNDWIKSGTYEIEVSSKRYPITVQLQAFHDPKGERAKQ
jgi:hypothetical protein